MNELINLADNNLAFGVYIRAFIAPSTPGRSEIRSIYVLAGHPFSKGVKEPEIVGIII